MRLLVAAIGKASKGPERELVERYVERADPLARTLGFGRLDLAERPESRMRAADERKVAEAADLLALAGPGAALLALDERGADIGSEALAARLAALRDQGVPTIAFLIGGPDGHGEPVRAKATTIAFGRATWPHLLVRAMVCEQIYRALTILAGHPYHRQ